MSNRFHCSQHVVYDNSLLPRGIVVETGWPPLKGFKTEREGILPWHES